MAMERTEGLNFDYLLAVKEGEGKLWVEKIEIERHYLLITKLFYVFKQPTSDAVDLYRCAKKGLKYNQQVFDCSLGHDYADACIKGLMFPAIDITAYNKKLFFAKKQITAARVSGRSREADELEAKLRLYIRQKKEKYMQDVLCYIYTYDYSETLRKFKLKENRTLFSWEEHGWVKHEFNFSDGVTILVQTNFGVGSESSFQIIVKYDDSEKQLRRTYPCRRASWSQALSFIVELANGGEAYISDSVNREAEK